VYRKEGERTNLHRGNTYPDVSATQSSSYTEGMTYTEVAFTEACSHFNPYPISSFIKLLVARSKLCLRQSKDLLTAFFWIILHGTSRHLQPHAIFCESKKWWEVQDRWPFFHSSNHFPKDFSDSISSLSKHLALLACQDCKNRCARSHLSDAFSLSIGSG